jgi:hypothetical protein
MDVLEHGDRRRDNDRRGQGNRDDHQHTAIAKGHRTTSAFEHSRNRPIDRPCVTTIT